MSGRADTVRVAAPLTYFADPAQMAAWLDHAAPRQRLIYASGPNLGGGVHPAAALARSWRDNGRAALITQRSRTRPGCTDYVAEKMSLPAGARTDGGLPGEWEHRPEGALYRLLQARAEAGSPCPSLAEMAEALDLPDRHAARHRFRKLVRAGAVRVVDAPPRCVPVIEIVATGVSTKGVKA